MKTVFKPLGVAAAVAAVTAGYTSAVTAQEVSSRNVGDLALIPYYTVQDGFATAVHIINTSRHTQVVKLRFRRGRDSADSLDFNLIMSPKDEWVGSMTQRDDSHIVVTTRDQTCTAPAGTPTGEEGKVEFVMPDQDSVETLVDFRVGAEEGYIEVIAMGQPSTDYGENSAIAAAAKHVNGVPADCGAVRSNFFRVPGAENGEPPVLPQKGVYANNMTKQTCIVPTVTPPGAPQCVGLTAGSPGLVDNMYTDSVDDALKVSWAVTDAASGLEVGSNAVHIEGFAEDPMITNQQAITLGGRDKLGYLFPDLDGGSPGFAPRGLFEPLRTILGADSVVNDWTSRSTDAFDVQTDWVVTMPGQYLMVDPLQYLASLNDPNDVAYSPCLTTAQAALTNPASEPCDFRDIPAALDITYYDREEGAFTPEEGGLVVSPAINLTPDGIALPYETNVIYWKVDADQILRSQYGVAFSPQFEEDRGWSELKVTAAANKEQGIWTYVDPNDPNEDVATAVQEKSIPIIGFAAWERSFADSPDANYGRAVDHSYGSDALPD